MLKVLRMYFLFFDYLSSLLSKVFIFCDIVLIYE